ncbi:MAG: nuclear transport factor 2 family protein [Acidobacteriota bacterium]
MSQETVHQIIHNYFTAISTLNCEAWLNTFAADAVSHEPGNPPLAGHEALRAFFNGVAGGFETIEMKPDQIFAVGNEAGVKWSARGTGKNGRQVAFEGVDVFAVNDAGKIQLIKAYWDPAAMMAELMG